MSDADWMNSPEERPALGEALVGGMVEEGKSEFEEVLVRKIDFVVHDSVAALPPRLVESSVAAHTASLPLPPSPSSSSSDPLVDSISLSLASHGASSDTSSLYKGTFPPPATTSAGPPPLPPPPFFLRWSHAHVYASPRVLIDGLNSHLSDTTVSCSWDAKDWQFSCRALLQDSDTQKSPKQRSLRAAKSATEFHSVSFAVQVYTADHQSSHHVVEFHSASRCPPRLFRATFDGCLVSLKSTPGVAKVLPPGAATTNTVQIAPLPAYNKLDTPLPSPPRTPITPPSSSSTPVRVALPG